jgi:hypothetical protein
MAGAVIGKAVAAGARAALRAAMSLGGKLTAKRAAEFARQQLTSIIQKFGLKLKALAVKQARNSGIKAGKGKEAFTQSERFIQGNRAAGVTKKGVKELDEDIDRPLTTEEVKSDFVGASLGTKKDLSSASSLDVGERGRVLAEYGMPVSMG